MKLAGAGVAFGIFLFFAFSFWLPNSEYSTQTVSFIWAVPVTIILSSFAFVIFEGGLFTYVLRRLGQSLFVVFVIASVTFILLRYLPGGPFDSEKALPPEVKANIEAKYRLNDPVMTQYFHYLIDLSHGDLGKSYKYEGRDVTEIVAESFPVSLQLGFYSLILSFLIGIPLGVLAGAKHNTWMDTSAMLAAMSGVALPSFLVAPILILIFCYHFSWLPVSQWETPWHYILPVVTLGVRPAAIIARLTRSSVLDVIRSDFVRTARAKGVAERYVLFKHVLRNSLIPVITISGPLMAAILSGSFVIEIIFNIPGIGRHFVQSVTNRDYPLTMAVTLLFAGLLIVANFIVDLLYVVVDPRIKLQGGR